MTRSSMLSLVLALLTMGPTTLRAAETRSLAGEWRVQLDPRGVGLSERWFGRALADTIHLPGSIDEAKLGPPNAAPPTLDGLYRLHPYEGAAWYQTTAIIPGSWKGKRVALFLERPHGETRIWVDGQEIPGVQDSLTTPHVHELGDLGKPGTRRITIRLDNSPRIDLGPFVSIRYEGTQTNWNGIVGAIELRAVDPVAIEELQVFPDRDRQTARCRLTLSNTTGRPVQGRLRLALQSGPGAPELIAQETAITLDGRAEVVRDLELGAAMKLWDEFSPALYILHAALTTEAGDTTYRDERVVRFGVRSFAADGTRFLLNGRPIMLRGTLECGIFPKTGYPPTDAASWRRIYRITKSYGLNFLRFHSWCPPDAAFAAADAEGIILQVEGPQANVPAGKDPARDAFLEAELLRIVRTYGNHPSFCLMALGNEFGGKPELLERWVGMLRDEDPRHLYSSAAAAQVTPNRQFTEGGPRGVKGPGTDRDFRAELAKQDRPLVGHEIGQWTFFPNFDEIPKYDGVLAAKNFELVRDQLQARHMLDLAPRFVQATGQHAVLLYKEEIEVLLRTPKYAGFSLLDLHDYPGQGTALIGLLDPFWDSKGFISPEVHKQYCGPTVPLLRLPKRTYTTDEPLLAEVELAHFGPESFAAVTPVWTIQDAQGRAIASGSLEPQPAPTGELTRLGSLRVALDKVAAPARLTVSVALKGTEYQNQWQIWVYPPDRQDPVPPGIVVSRDWDETTRAALAAGKPVILLPRLVNTRQSLPGRFLPVFWSPVWFPDQKPNTMGILCDPRHPLFARFPTDMHSNWQWYELLDASRSVVLDDTPATFHPIVQVIDNFARNHKLGTVFETRVGPGRLLVCTIDLPKLAPTHPAARQLLSSLHEYAASEAFRPGEELGPAWLDAMFAPQNATQMQRLGARIARVDSQQAGHEASQLLDGDPATIWHTTWGEGAAPFPHEVVIAFEKPVTLAGVRCQPREDMRNGWIKDYRIEVSPDDRTWSNVARGSFDRSSQEKTVKFAAPTSARFLKLIAVSAFDDQPFASLADLTVIDASP